MNNTIRTSDDTELRSKIRAALLQNPARVQRIQHDGRAIWLKRPETLSFVRRLQKGNATATFNAERAALHILAERGAPVPEILDEGPDFLALADSGAPLSEILTAGDMPATKRLQVFAAAGRALAQLHRSGLSHGRPSLKDICWNGSAITFLDFERFAEHRNTAQGHAMDLIMFVFNGLVVGGGRTPELTTAIASYRKDDPGQIWERAQKWCARRRWINWLTWPIQQRAQGKAKEFKAIPITLEVFSER